MWSLFPTRKAFLEVALTTLARRARQTAKQSISIRQNYSTLLRHWNRHSVVTTWCTGRTVPYISLFSQLHPQPKGSISLLWSRTLTCAWPNLIIRVETVAYRPTCSKDVKSQNELFSITLLERNVAVINQWSLNPVGAKSAHSFSKH